MDGTRIQEGSSLRLPFSGRVQEEWSRLTSGRYGRRLERILGDEKSSGIRRIQKIIQPRLSFAIKTIDRVDGDSVTLEGGVVLKSGKLAWVLECCRLAVCFVATIGPGVEREISRLSQEGCLTGEYLLDRIGSLAVEAVVDDFQREMGERYGGANGGTTLRFSPGYCDWPITEQRKIFSLVDSRRAGVRLTPSLLMVPRKSISGVFGIIEEGRPTWRAFRNPCLQCDRRNCPERREPRFSPSAGSVRKRRAGARGDG